MEGDAISVASDIVSSVNSINTSVGITVNAITDAMISDAWTNVCESLQNETNSITERAATGTWTSADESTYGLNHFKQGIRDVIKAGKAVIPYKCTKSGFEKVVIITNSKIYKFPTNNLTYFASAQYAVEKFGAASYFDSVNQTTNKNTALSQGNSRVQNYNYTQ